MGASEPEELEDDRRPLLHRRRVLGLVAGEGDGAAERQVGLAGLVGARLLVGIFEPAEDETVEVGSPRPAVGEGLELEAARLELLQLERPGADGARAGRAAERRHRELRRGEEGGELDRRQVAAGLEGDEAVGGADGAELDGVRLGGALQRRDDVGGAHRAAVVEADAVTERDREGARVLGAGPAAPAASAGVGCPAASRR